jgi:hypothetical protein
LINENRRLMLENRHISIDYNELVSESDRMADKIIALEFVLDELSDKVSTLEGRIDYWRRECTKLKKAHKNCHKKKIILYR